jgi:hypothetical protein
MRIADSAMPLWRKQELIVVCQNMGNWFGDRAVGDLAGDLQRAYAEQRGFPSAAYRDLKILAAAINRQIKDKVGGIQAKSLARLIRQRVPERLARVVQSADAA